MKYLFNNYDKLTHETPKIHVSISFKDNLWKIIVDHVQDHENYKEKSINQDIINVDIKKPDFEYLFIIIEYLLNINTEFYRYLVIIFEKNHLLNMNI